MARFTVDFSPEFDQLLEKVAASKQLTKAEVIRRAVASYSFLDSQTDPTTGTKLSVTSKDDKVLKDVVLP
jgi:predicted transcriptional regulator